MKTYHWWPGREWRRGFCPIPEKYVQNAKRMKSKYMTAVMDNDGQWGASYCRHTDQVDKKVGRVLAILHMCEGK